MDHDHEESEEEHDEESDHTESSDRTVNLTGFLFGNIDKKGQLIDDVLDEVCTNIRTLLHFSPKMFWA